MLVNTDSTCAESLVCTCICWFVLVAARDSVSVGQYQELSMNVHVSALLEIRSGLLRMCWPVSRAERVFVIFCTIRAPGMQACVSARIMSRAYFRMCVCTYEDTLSPRNPALECKSVCLPLCVFACATRQDLTARASVCLCVYARAALVKT